MTAARVTLGAICLSSSSHFAAMPYSNATHKTGGVAAGRARLSTKPAPTGSVTPANTIGTVRVACSNGATVELPMARDYVGRECDQFCRVFSAARHRPRPSGCRSAHCRRRSSPIAAAAVGMPRGEPVLPDRPRRPLEHADAPHPLGLLRACGERPRRCTAQGHERYCNILMLRINSSSARPPTTDIVVAVCSLTAGIGLEKRWKPEGPQRSAVHDSAAQWTCLRQTLLQMQKLQRYRERRPRKLSLRRGQSTHSWIFFSSSGRRRRGSRQ